ncbi:MAG: transporter [Flavobacterium sp.]
MHRIFFRFIPCFFFVLSFHAQHTDIINSNRPGESMTAFSVGKNVSQIESGIYGISEKHQLLQYDAKGLGIDLAIRYGLFLEQLEFIGNIQYQLDKYNSPITKEDRSAIKYAVIGAKYLVYDPYKYYEEKVNIYSWKANQKFKWRQLIPIVAVYAGANLNFTNNPFYALPVEESNVSAKAMLVTQNHFGQRWVLVTNTFMDKIGSETQNFGYLITLTHAFNQKFSGFLENKGIMGDFYSDQILTTGLAYLMGTNMQVDISVSKNFKNTPDILYGGVGFSIRFDKKHKPVVLLGPDKSQKPGKEDKKKKKEKERVKEAIENNP